MRTTPSEQFFCKPKPGRMPPYLAGMLACRFRPEGLRPPKRRTLYMLALARSEGQSIIIDGKIEVKVVKWSRSSVRLAIQAPREVAVDREEIWRKMNPGQPSPLEKAEQERQKGVDNA